MQFFFTELAIGLGASFPWTSFLFNPRDVFADSIKLVTSCRTFLSSGLHWVAPLAALDSLYSLFNAYLDSPYGDNPLVASSALTHFMLPPQTQLFFIASARLLSVADPLFFWRLRF
ncbi:MAG: hypothetical protein VKK97_04915 [Synechococcaceae cyanobacterium]|nr:hypothetical protein [Synechococcaceae cyanobacterium]